MKSLALLTIAGAFSLYGSAFLGVWTAPGLEGLPTYKTVINGLPWEKPAEVDPRGEIVPIPASAQLVPHGVTANWGDVPLIYLPDRNPEQERLQKVAKPVASTAAAPTRPAAARPTISTSNPKPPIPAARQASTSYALTGSSIRTQTTSASIPRSRSSRGSSAASPRFRNQMQFRTSSRRR